MRKYKEKIMGGVFFAAALTSILAVLLICVFLFANGIPAMGKVGLFKFLAGTNWAPTDSPASFGIFPMILGSIYVTAGAIVIGVPVGILTSIFMSRYCPKPLYKILKPATELLAGIPSIVYGFFRTCGACSVRKNGFRRKRKQYAYSLDFAWNNDFADNYRCIGKCDKKCTRKLL